MKGYFGIGVEGVSKAMNVGTLFRTAHAFDAAFVFTLRAQYNRREGALSDTKNFRLRRFNKCIFFEFFEGRIAK